MRVFTIPFFIASSALLSCAESTGTEDDSLLADPFQEFPSSFRDVGLYPEAGDREVVATSAIAFQPALPLWSNGLDKERFVVVPEGEAIDISDRLAWDIPVGTLFFKTFSIVGEDAGSRPVETRVIRRTTRDTWDYAAYQWNEGGTDAELLPMTKSVPVPVAVGDEAFDHLIPSKLDCRTCHESNATRIIGFDELRLAAALPGHEKTQLEEVHERGVLKGPLPAEPDRVSGASELETKILGYVHGNCAHCHNATGGPSSSFDMRHQVMIENTVGKKTESGASAAGIRIDAGEPEESILFLAFSGETTDPEVKAMPPVGVQLRDRAAALDLRSWILSLSSGRSSERGRASSPR